MTTAPPTAAANRSSGSSAAGRTSSSSTCPWHASWLNQVEIYFSIVQRKVLQPNDFENLGEVARTLNAFERHWRSVAEPFDWRFTRQDLEKLTERLAAHEPPLRLAA